MSIFYPVIYSCENQTARGTNDMWNSKTKALPNNQPNRPNC